MHMFSRAIEDLAILEDQVPDLTIDQQIALLQVRALLSISQELSNIHNDGLDVVVHPEVAEPGPAPATAKAEPGPPRRLR